jgi:hypothetical protein
MPALGTFDSVRGTLSNGRSYRDIRRGLGRTHTVRLNFEVKLMAKLRGSLVSSVCHHSYDGIGDRGMSIGIGVEHTG